jgi:hypothetical protein
MGEANMATDAAASTDEPVVDRSLAATLSRIVHPLALWI